MLRKLTGPMRISTVGGAVGLYKVGIAGGGSSIRDWIMYQIKVINKSSNDFQLGVGLDHSPDGDIWASYNSLRDTSGVGAAPALITLSANLRTQGPIGEMIRLVLIADSTSTDEWADVEVWENRNEADDGFLYAWRKQQITWQEFLRGPMKGPYGSWPPASSGWPGPI